MTTYYVGPGGNDGNSGLTWALRKLTLNGAEDVPVVAGDTVYVGPGVYREMLTVDVSGGAGTEITYIGDVTGVNTDDVGGIVRITGSDNDQTAVRNYCITADAKDYRIFRGFFMDTTSLAVIYSSGGSDDWTIEDCIIYREDAQQGIYVFGTSADWIIRRCIVTAGPYAGGIQFREDAGIANAGHLVENCIVNVQHGYCIISYEVGGIDIRNCWLRGYRGVSVAVALPGGYTAIDVNNSILDRCTTGVYAQVLGEIVENYNTFWGNQTNRTNVNVGGNSVTYPPLFVPPILFSGASQVGGFEFPWWYGELSEWSQIRAITGTNEPTEDLRGFTRPTTASKCSWGPLQFADMERETGTTRGASTASLCLHDAGRHQIWVPMENSSTTVSIYVYREANYAGVLPQMVLRQPGQADRTTTDVGAAGGWNQLTDTWTPAVTPPYVIVELVSNNTAGAGNYATFFDDLTIS
ncbi:MAG: hypothetical protein PVJ86_00065 [Phycisphaerales bacterium]|jgi:hypothetical protein